MKAGHGQPQQGVRLTPPFLPFTAFGFKSYSISTHRQKKPGITHPHGPAPERWPSWGGQGRGVKGLNWKERQSFTQSLCREAFYVLMKIFPTEGKGDASVKHRISPKSERLEVRYRANLHQGKQMRRGHSVGDVTAGWRARIHAVTDPNPS